VTLFQGGAARNVSIFAHHSYTGGNTGNAVYVDGVAAPRRLGVDVRHVRQLHRGLANLRDM